MGSHDVPVPPSGRQVYRYGLLLNDQPVDLLLQVIECLLLEKARFEGDEQARAALRVRIGKVRGIRPRRKEMG